MYLALRDGPRRFNQNFSCSDLLGITLTDTYHFDYGTITLYGPAFQTGFVYNMHKYVVVPLPRIAPV